MISEEDIASFDIDQQVITSASEVEESKLIEFYKRTYNKRSKVLSSNWEWLYRSNDYDGKIPLIIEYKGEVIAQAAMIPFDLRLNNKILKALWYVDFAVLPEFQRKGIGIKMTQKWMEFGDIHVTFCNPRSLGVFKKFGWKEGSKANNHIISLLPGNQRPFIRQLPLALRKFINAITNKTLFSYSKHACSKKLLTTRPLESEDLSSMIETNNSDGPIRDKEFLDWRVTESPCVESYRIFEIKNLGISGLIKFTIDRNVSILTINTSEPKSVLTVLSTVAIWAMDQGYFNVFYLTTDKAVSDEIKNRLNTTTSKPIFAYHSHDKNLEELFSKSTIHWDRLDSDFDLI